MTPIRINFSKGRVPWRTTGSMLILAAIVGAGMLADQYRRKLSALDELQSKQAKLLKIYNDRSAASKSAAVLSPDLQERLKAAQDVLDKLALPWEPLFQALETTADGNVVLLSLEPDPEKKEIRIGAEAKDMEAMLAYVDRLRDVSVLKKVYISGHQIQMQNPQKPVRFMVGAQWTVMAGTQAK